VIWAEELGERNELDARQPDRAMETLTERLLDLSGQPTYDAQVYALWSPTSSDFDVAYGLESRLESVSRLEAFQRCSYWEVVLAQEGTYLFRFEPTRYPRSPL
jgi:hypothetical protein